MQLKMQLKKAMSKNLNLLPLIFMFENFYYNKL